MICCVQRVLNAEVSIDGAVKGGIDNGLLLFLGVEKGDTSEETIWTAEKVANLRIFNDDCGKMGLSVADIGGRVLIISQFTLAGDCRKGRRPDFAKAELPERAKEIYNEFIAIMAGLVGNDNVESGIFGADMKVRLINDGPVTLIVEKRAEC